MAKRRGTTGENTSTVTYSPAGLIGIERARARQEDRWARKSGPVETRMLEEGEEKPKRKDWKETSPFRRRKIFPENSGD